MAKSISAIAFPVFQVRRLCCAVLIACAIFGLAAGCQQKGPAANAKDTKETPVVPVSHPVIRQVVDYVDYTGRTDAVQTVSIRPRVQGILTSMPFKEGSDVNKDDVLFEIDARPYKAAKDYAEAQLKSAQEKLRLAKANYARDKLARSATAEQQLDSDKAAVDVADATINGAQAQLDTAQLNLDWTKVRAPISGLISRYYYTVGNLVIQDSTLLTTIVAMDTMYVYFDMDEGTFNRFKMQFGYGNSPVPMPVPKTTGEKDKADKDKAQPSVTAKLNEVGIPVYMALDRETGYPHQGRIDFINNQVNPATGTIAVRAIFKNERVGGDGAWIFYPGMFARIHLPIGQAHTSMLVKDSAIGSDQGQKFLYVVDAEDRVQYRAVTTGSLQEDGLRVVESDQLKPDDWVIVGGLQQLRPKTIVQSEKIVMPTSKNGVVESRNRPQPPPPGEQGPKKGK